MPWQLQWPIVRVSDEDHEDAASATSALPTAPNFPPVLTVMPESLSLQGWGALDPSPMDPDAAWGRQRMSCSRPTP